MPAWFPSQNNPKSATGEFSPLRIKEIAAGVLIMGTGSGCGKTVFMSGLAALLREQGFLTRAVKPIVLGVKQQAESELSFISTVTHTPLTYSTTIVDRRMNLNQSNWHYAVASSRSVGELTMVELPGSCATPLSFDQDNGTSVAVTWKDSTDLAREFDLPVILVTKHQSDALEQLILNATYLKDRELKVIGCATVETKENGGRDFENRMSRPEVELSMLSRTQVPYVGCVKFSPSISVPHVNQGNLVKVTAAGIDLLVLIKALNLKISTEVRPPQ